MRIHVYHFDVLPFGKILSVEFLLVEICDNIISRAAGFQVKKYTYWRFLERIGSRPRNEAITYKMAYFQY